MKSKKVTKQDIVKKMLAAAKANQPDKIGWLQELQKLNSKSPNPTQIPIRLRDQGIVRGFWY